MEAYTADSGAAGHSPASGDLRAHAAPTPRPQGHPTRASQRATIRTWRHGAGDSHLVTLLGEGGQTCRILIGGRTAPDGIVEDILEQTGGHVDLLVDFAGSFHSAEASAKLDAGEVWLAWTEDPANPEARALHAKRERALDKLRLAAAEVQLRGSADESRAIAALLAYYGVAGRACTGDPLAAVRDRATAPVYRRPGDGPFELAGVGARIYLFGQSLGAAGLDARASGAGLALDEFVRNVMPNLEGTAVDNPFSTLYSIPEPVAQAMPFFQQHYWGDVPWRRIDTAWITDATQLGLVLDGLTNSTSLGMAIEIDGGDVLLFAPAGQGATAVLSGQQAWSAGGRQIEGRDLLARTVFYKVGHHAGPGAFVPDASALMPRLRVALIPVDQAALSAQGDAPIDALQHALAETIGDRGYVLRTDQDPPALALNNGVTATERYFDVQL